MITIRLRKSLLSAIYLLSLTFASSQVCAQIDTKLEREKRHVVSRMAELIYMGQRDCQNLASSEKQEFNDALAKFRATNPEFFRLFEVSKYFLDPQGPYKLPFEDKAIDPSNCKIVLSMLRNLLSPEGQNVMRSYVELLGK